MKKIIEVKNLYKSYQKLEVLKGVNFNVYEGEIISIIGSSGSGKSTLLRCLNLLEIPTKGDIYFENVNIVSESININKSLDSLISINLEKGNHVIELKFEPNGLKLGIIISSISVITTIILYLYDKKQNSKCK